MRDFFFGQGLIILALIIPCVLQKEWNTHTALRFFLDYGIYMSNVEEEGMEREYMEHSHGPHISQELQLLARHLYFSFEWMAISTFPSEISPSRGYFFGSVDLRVSKD